MPRSPETRAKLVAAAQKAIAEGGEAAVRIADVVREVGVSISAIEHHFGGRDGLIQAAQYETFTTRIGEDVDGFAAALAQVSTPIEARAVASAALARFLQPDHIETRVSEMSVFGSAAGRPELLQMVGEMNATLMDRLSAALEDGRERGLLRPDVDTDALATFVFAYTTGLFMHDIAPRSVDAHRMSALVDRLLAVLFAEGD